MDIEKYLKNELSETEKRAFEAEMERSEVLRNAVARERELHDQLESYFIRQEIREALKHRDEAPEKEKMRPVYWKWWIAGGLGLLLIALTFKVLNRTGPPVLQEAPAPASEPTDPQNQVQSPVVPIDRKPKPDEDKVRAKPVPEVVVVSDIRPENFGPAFREAAADLQQKDLTGALASLAGLEQPAPGEDEVRALDEDEEARLDTLAYLKGLALLQLRRGGDAARCFSRLDEAGKPWREEAQFYLLQAWLSVGEKGKAGEVLGKIREKKGHKFLKMSEKAWPGG
ncbi:MAG TPA: hypothetical protein PK228_22360 [Saprospiraceae bacterium]|nr:hypothetical protein [Saprospiraceae bacterium]